MVQTLGYAGVAALIALENLFPPLPSKLILPLAGFLAGQGRLSFVGVVAVATAGSLAGALVRPSELETGGDETPESVSRAGTQLTMGRAAREGSDRP